MLPILSYERATRAIGGRWRALRSRVTWRMTALIATLAVILIWVVGIPIGHSTTMDVCDTCGRSVSREQYTLVFIPYWMRSRESQDARFDKYVAIPHTHGTRTVGIENSRGRLFFGYESVGCGGDYMQRRRVVNAALDSIYEIRDLPLATRQAVYQRLIASCRDPDVVSERFVAERDQLIAAGQLKRK